MGFKLKDLYCYLEVLPEDQGEAIIQSGRVDPETKQIFVMPLITGSEKMAQSMKGVAQTHANETNHKVILVKLATREDIETIEAQLVQEPSAETRAAVNDFLKKSS